MPLYEYQCMKCGAIEEAIQKFSDPPLGTCRQCSGKLNRLISQSSFHLKGTGWYVTDYSKKSASAANSNNSEAPPPAAEKNAAGSVDSKSVKKDT
jgi:putative FmdB family regulatory protein